MYTQNSVLYSIDALREIPNTPKLYEFANALRLFNASRDRKKNCVPVHRFYVDF